LTSDGDILKEARTALEEGNKEVGAKLLLAAANRIAEKGEYQQAAMLYEEVAMIFRDSYKATESFEAFENVTLMLIRLPQEPEVYKEIVRVNKVAGKIAEEAAEYQKAADYYFRAQDFAASDGERAELSIKAADALEILADNKEEEEDFAETLGLLRKVSRLYFTANDEELGERINVRAVRIAQRWAEKSKEEGDFLSAGNALAEAAQIMGMKGESPEAMRVMMEAGEYYEAAELFEKAGNIYDAAQEAYKLQRLTSARKQAMTKAAEAYLKARGAPESVAPLLIKAGNMFKEIGRTDRAKWAFLHANELFGELAEKAKAQNDVESEMKYLRFQAMCLWNWGKHGVAGENYVKVISHYLNEAKREEEAGNKELQAVALEEAAEVLRESGKETVAAGHIEHAIELYIQLADEASTSNDPEGSSKLYSKAAECALKLDDKERHESLHRMASEKAESAAGYYQELGVPELATIWLRTAGNEALITGSSEMIERSVDLLSRSAEGFKEAKEYKESFEDLFTVFETRFIHYPDRMKPINAVIMSMDEVASTAHDEMMNSIVAFVRALNSGNHIGALFILQDNEEDLLDKASRMRKLIEQSKVVRRMK
jgi:tetratricopeptide (TPR) repeat protein